MGNDKGFSRGEDVNKLTGRCYTLKHGNPARLKIERLWWKPGTRVRDFFHELGEWSVGASSAQPTIWRKIDKLPVFSFTDASNWDVDSVDWTVGTNDPVAFLRDEAWAGFDPENDEHDREELQESYEESIQRLLREVIGNCVPVRFSTHDLQAFMPTKTVRIQKVRYHYADDNGAPHEITVTNAAGEEMRLRLL